MSAPRASAVGAALVSSPTLHAWEAVRAAWCDVAPAWDAATGADGSIQQSDDWRLTPAALCFAARLVHHLGPAHVLEFGSGESTRVLARACADLDARSTLCAIENDPTHARATRASIESDGLDEFASVLLAPLVVRRCHGRLVPVYDLADCGGRPDRPSVILVDGPPLPLGGREGALYQALHAAAEGSVVLLDDSRRPSEIDALERVQRSFEGSLAVMDLLGFPKGLAVILVTHPVRADDLPEELVYGA